MSIETNKRIVHRWLDAWLRQDLDAIDQIFAPSYSVNGAHAGPEGVKQAVQYLHAAFSSIALTVDDLIAEGDRVAVRWTLRGVHSGVFMSLAPTGRPIQLTGINIYRIAGDQIESNHEQVDIAGLRQQLEAAASSGESA